METVGGAHRQTPAYRDQPAAQVLAPAMAHGRGRALSARAAHTHRAAVAPSTARADGAATPTLVCLAATMVPMAPPPARVTRGARAVTSAMLTAAATTRAKTARRRLLVDGAALATVMMMTAASALATRVHTALPLVAIHALRTGRTILLAVQLAFWAWVSSLSCLLLSFSPFSSLSSLVSLLVLLRGAPASAHTSKLEIRDSRRRCTQVQDLLNSSLTTQPPLCIAQTPTHLLLPPTATPTRSHTNAFSTQRGAGIPLLLSYPF
mmetsp:Transcript_24482/g.61984  ORF Transcript_24482/g.61984 Transcript_24482/m.61984 type:complete len:265 (+) Transcript_24482:154-948(+)